MHDVLAVMDAAGSGQAVVVGYSEGGPMALMLAATHPERVSSLVLYGAYARRSWAPDHPWGWDPAARLAYTEKLVTTWDWESDLLMRCPSGDRAMQQWWSRRMRAAATPTTVRALMDMNALVDVRGLLPTVATPTLVVNRTGDALCRPEEAAYIADRVPGATLRLLEGADHFVAGDPAQILDAIEPFLAAVPKPEQHRVLAAVTSVAGPDAADLRAALVAGGAGERRTGAGDPVVLFDGPATAVRAVLAALGRHPESAVGVSVAEVVVGGGPVSGPAVDRAVRLGQHAGPGAVLVTATAGALLSGSGVELAGTDDPDALRVVAG
jgi:hypothetical protein